MAPIIGTQGLRCGSQAQRRRNGCKLRESPTTSMGPMATRAPEHFMPMPPRDQMVPPVTADDPTRKTAVQSAPVFKSPVTPASPDRRAGGGGRGAPM